MKKENITISIEQEKLRAIKRYTEKKDINMEKELQAALQKLYEKYVPSPVQEYIDANIALRDGSTPSVIVSER